MNINQTKRLLPYLIKCKIAPWFWGYHGKGKTETITGHFQELGWMLFNFRLNCMVDVGDFLGLQDFTVDPKTGEKIASKFCMPDWLKQCIDFCNANPTLGAVVFIDEINRAARLDLLGPIFQMALDHRLHTYAFPPNLHIVCASNPNTSDYSLLSVKDKALLSRFCHLLFNPTKEEWFDYADQQDYDKSLIGFYKEHPEALERTDLASFSVADYTEPDRRKGKFLNDLLKAGLPEDLRLETFAGFIGIENAAAYERYREEQDKALMLDDILNSYDTVRDFVKKCSQDGSIRTDILNKAANEVITFYKDGNKFEKKQAVNTVRFIEDLPNDQMWNVLHSIYNDRKFHDFCEENYHLFTNIEKRVKAIRSEVEPETVKDLLDEPQTEAEVFPNAQKLIAESERIDF